MWHMVVKDIATCFTRSGAVLHNTGADAGSCLQLQLLGEVIGFKG
jgi:hypothetical protein